MIGGALSVYVQAKNNHDNDGADWVTVTQGTQASVSTLAAADYNDAGAASNPTEGIDVGQRKDITGVATSQYLGFTLNATGTGWVSKTGHTKLALREGHDATGSAFTGSSGQYNGMLMRSAAYSGTSYDPVLEVIYLPAALPPVEVVLQDIQYEYDEVGNITQIVDASDSDSAKTVSYAYDDLHRLVSATAAGVAPGQTGYAESYAYDAIGNITSGPAGTYLYEGDQGSSMANPHAATSVGAYELAYDANGNLVSRDGTSYTWDYNNRLTSVDNGTGTSTYAYDHTGRRIRADDGTTVTVYPGADYSTDGTEATKHVTLGGTALATVTGTGAAAAAKFMHTDHLTGTSVVTDAAGTQAQLLDYYPYGGIRIDEKAGSFDEKRKFAGHEYDAATGLSYMKARYYDSSVGRFASQDQLFREIGDRRKVKDIAKKEMDEILADPQNLNAYAYARNNPLKYVDPDGNNYVGLNFSFKALAGLSFGIQVDRSGVVGFISYGAAYGAYGAPVQLVLSEADLTHKPETTLSIEGIAGGVLGLSSTTEIRPDSNSLGLQDAEASVAIVIAAGGGAAVSANVNHSRPIYTWDKTLVDNWGGNGVSYSTAGDGGICPITPPTQIRSTDKKEDGSKQE